MKSSRVVVTICKESILSTITSARRICPVNTSLARMMAVFLVSSLVTTVIFAWREHSSTSSYNGTTSTISRLEEDLNKCYIKIVKVKN